MQITKIRRKHKNHGNPHQFREPITSQKLQQVTNQPQITKNPHQVTKTTPSHNKTTESHKQSQNNHKNSQNSQNHNITTIHNIHRITQNTPKSHNQFTINPQ